MDNGVNVKHGESWEACEPQLARVVKSSEVGHTIFAFAVEKLKRSLIRKLIDSIIEKQHETNVTDSSLQSAREQLLHTLHAKGHQPHTVGPSYAIEVSYCGVLVPLMVHSPIDELLAHQAAFTHTIGVETNVSPRLFCEGELIPSGRPRPTITIDEACVADSRRARLAATSLIKQKQADNGADMVQTLREYSATLSPLGSHWRIEFSFFDSHVGEKGENRFMAMVEAALPSLQRPRATEQSLAELDRLGKSTIASFCGLGAIAIYTSVRDWVTMIHEQRPRASKRTLPSSLRG